LCGDAAWRFPPAQVLEKADDAGLKPAAGASARLSGGAAFSSCSRDF